MSHQLAKEDEYELSTKVQTLGEQALAPWMAGYSGLVTTCPQG